MSSMDEMRPIVVKVKEDEESDAYRFDPRFAYYDDDFPEDKKTTTVEGEPPMRLPNLSVYQFAGLVLGQQKSRMWIRYQLENGKSRIDGTPFAPKLRVGKGGTGAYSTMTTLTIPDMERLCYAFLANGAITGEQYQRGMRVLTALAAVVDVKPRRSRTGSQGTPEAPTSFVCPLCKLPFGTERGLKIHFKKAHNETGDEDKPEPKTRAPRKGAIPKGDQGKSSAVQIVFKEAESL